LINDVMIILRQKEHSSKLMKVVRTMKRAGNNIVTAIDNAGLKAGNTAKEIVTGKPTPAHMKVRFRPKTNQQINRETVNQVRGTQKAIKDTAEGIYYTPGQMVDKGIKYSAENPIAATGNAASVVLPAVNPVWAAIPVGGPSIGVEAAAKKVGFYKKGTQRLGEAYRKSGVSRGLRSMGSLPETASQFGQMIPL
jgi:hypothetical protein